MRALMWKLSTAIRHYLRTYMPTNIALDLLRIGPGLKWAVPAALALVVVLAYLFAASMATRLIERGGPGWLNVLVAVFIWNAMKFAWMALLRLLMWLRGTRTCRVLSPARACGDATQVEAPISSPRRDLNSPQPADDPALEAATGIVLGL